MTTPSKYDSAWTDAMLNMADVWEVYPSTTSYRGLLQGPDGPVPHDFVDVPCVRCHACDYPLLGDDTPMKAQHMVQFHGYRMDGRKESEQ